VSRFRCSDPLAGDFDFPDVEAVLDALEAALVTPDTPMLDTARQSWQPVAAHPEVRSAWAERARYRPPAAGPLSLPELPEVSVIVATKDEGAVQRKEAYARVRGLPVREAIPVEEVPQARRSPVLLLVAVGLVLVLCLVGWAVVSLAGRLASVAARAAGVGR
jgi:hypothetical protein